jgi:hypothetical protein
VKWRQAGGEGEGNGFGAASKIATFWGRVKKTESGPAKKRKIKKLKKNC